MNKKIREKGFKFFLLVIAISSYSLVFANSKSSDLNHVKIDGILDESLWVEAERFSDFVQIEPEIYALSTVKSEFYFTYDSENIYVGGVLFQTKESISASNFRKDDPNLKESDYISIGIDPLNNGNSAFFFTINPVNAIGDGMIDIVGNFDYSWDAVFISATNIKNDSWTFEIKIPLTSINFQNKDTQTWGLMFSRKYAQNQELVINQLIDKNAPYRVSDFYKYHQIKNIRKSRKVLITPYLYGGSVYSELTDNYEINGKFGGEIKYNPTPSSTLLATFNPDYAQIEADKEIINTTDLPTTYQEKRPFFTESTDMYPGLAVNTRNILDINAGIKYKRVGKISKIDLTTVYDKEQNIWGLGNVRITDNSRYHLELISGIKSERTDYLQDYNYNVTLHGKVYFFKKQMQVYTWYGTINMPNGEKNEFESVNSVKWISRNWNAGIWNHFKSDLYNPEIVGSPALSNEVIVESWLGYTWYFNHGFFRKISLKSNLNYYDLYSDRGNNYFVNKTELKQTFNLGKKIGNWELIIDYKPNINQKFRFRDSVGFAGNRVYKDAFSEFILVDQDNHTITGNLKTDVSKDIGLELKYDNSLVRMSVANNYGMESFIKIGSKTLIAYSINYIDIKGSEYQKTYKQTINRVKAEYNITDKINLRLIYQPNRIEILTDEYVNQNNIINLMLSWEYSPGGKFFIVYNKIHSTDQYGTQPREYFANNHSLVAKFSKTF